MRFRRARMHPPQVAMEGIPQSKEAAAADLERLQRERCMVNGVVQNSAIVSSLNATLDMLSDQLYKTPTHFILELIQNADDNSYAPNVTPTLNLSLYEKEDRTVFRADSNEVGFTFKQLDALTLAGQSTKKAIVDRQKGYIGEKGIGFKSVFKVADVVQVASGYYEFKLDRATPIGMILPVPTEFPPSDRVARHTQFLLWLKGKEDGDNIHRDLEHIEPQLLLFLRKLRELRVSNMGTDSIYRLEAIRSDADYGGETATILRSRSDSEVAESSKYLILRHTVKGLPKESRREGVSVSEVVVAFAVRDEGSPNTETQKVFAFLPVGNYGFRFLMHADFLLVASRESLQYSCAWNSALRSGILAAVMQAFDRFIALPEVESGKGLRYTWLKYLPRPSEGRTTWDDLHRDILQGLTDKETFWSRDAGTPLQMAKNLYFVPQSYRFDGGALFNIPLINAKHLSFAYDGLQDETSLLGVHSLDLRGLRSEFVTWIDSVGIGGLKEQSLEWHRKVSSLFCQDQSLKEDLKGLPIIPLQDGRWAAARRKNLYLPARDRNEHVPNGVKISVVDFDASKDPVRRRFFEFLDIEEYSPRHVCKLILESHRHTNSTKLHKSDEELLAEGVYVFKHRSQLESDGAPLMYFLVVKDGETIQTRGEQLYLVDPTVEPPLVSKYRNTRGNPFTVLSDKYELAIDKELGPRHTRDFRQWLLRSSALEVASKPVLLRHSRLTAEWPFLAEQNVVDLLSVVKSVYSANPSVAPTILRQALEVVEMPCLDGVTRPLPQLAVPTPELVQKCPHIHFADFPSQNLEGWGFLSEFGVITVCDTRARLQELRALCKLPLENTSINKTSIKEIYEALNLSARKKAEIQEIRKEFLANGLVFVDKPTPRWLNHKSCVWKAPKSLRRVEALASHYPECKDLFHRCLGVESAGTKHVVNELCFPIPGEPNIEHRFADLMSLLDRLHSKGKDPLSRSEIWRLRHRPLFPVRRPRYHSEKGVVVMRSMDDYTWYIPDNTIFEDTFRDKVDMLSIPAATAKTLRNLFKILMLDHMFLSSAVKQEVKRRGKQRWDNLSEVDFNTRVKYLSQLGKISPNSNPDIANLHVWTVPSITMTMSLPLSDIEVVADDELITIQETDGRIDIFLRENMQVSDRSSVNFAVVRYLQKILKIDAENMNLAVLLMSAPLAELPKILAKNDISPPDGMGEDGSSNTGQNSRDNEAAAQSLNDKVPSNKNDFISANHREQDNPQQPTTIPEIRKRVRKVSPDEDSLQLQPPRKILILIDSDNDEVARPNPRARLRSASKTSKPETKPSANPDPLMLPPSTTPPPGPKPQQHPHNTRRQNTHNHPLKPLNEEGSSLPEITGELNPPNRQARTEKMLQSARTFRMADAQVPASGLTGLARRSLRIQAQSADGADAGFGEGRSVAVAEIGGVSPHITANSLSVPALATLVARQKKGGGGSGGDDRLFGRYYQHVSSRTRTTDQDDGLGIDENRIKEREIGFLGELFIHELFSRQISDWTFASWTSHMRSEAGHPRFTALQKDFADFTYSDRHGHMRKILHDAGVKLHPQWSNNTTFHLEVKATLGQCADAFYVSQNQVDKMRQFDGDPANAYIIIRVFGVEERNNTGIKFLRDPWSLFLDRALDIRSETGVYKVY